ncbi:hypothetical protein J5N97_013875 [Dioscorea zingiberensis]|uniref:Uncharacterized protein n=1 Tax=Dioscorea zingiberensis TaxID=325984 RepID=A0A9D5CRL5_9LILI|nr:hypothetical protein J5N97_013875 [Dioscorea zingiberensis]
MEALKRHQWSISIHAKAKGVGFKLKAFRILHRSRLSFILRIPGFPFYLKSRTELAREGSGKTRFLRFLRRIFRWKPKNVAEKKDVLCVKGSKVGKPERSGFQFPLQMLGNGIYDQN